MEELDVKLAQLLAVREKIVDEQKLSDGTYLITHTVIERAFTAEPLSFAVEQGSEEDGRH
jgi:hypothetical protein